MPRRSHSPNTQPGYNPNAGQAYDPFGQPLSPNTVPGSATGAYDPFNLGGNTSSPYAYNTQPTPQSGRRFNLNFNPDRLKDFGKISLDIGKAAVRGIIRFAGDRWEDARVHHLAHRQMPKHERKQYRAEKKERWDIRREKVARKIGHVAAAIPGVSGLADRVTEASASKANRKRRIQRYRSLNPDSYFSVRRAVKEGPLTEINRHGLAKTITGSDPKTKEYAARVAREGRLGDLNDSIEDFRARRKIEADRIRQIREQERAAKAQARAVKKAAQANTQP